MPADTFCFDRVVLWRVERNDTQNMAVGRRHSTTYRLSFLPCALVPLLAACWTDGLGVGGVTGWAKKKRKKARADNSITLSRRSLDILFLARRSSPQLWRAAATVAIPTGAFHAGEPLRSISQTPPSPLCLFSTTFLPFRLNDDDVALRVYAAEGPDSALLLHMLFSIPANALSIHSLYLSMHLFGMPSRTPSLICVVC